MTVREALLKIKFEGPKVSPTCGICTNLIDYPGFVADMSPLWPRYSGIKGYPVPAADNSSPIRAYYEAQGAENMWDRNQSYGQARWELLDFLITMSELQEILLQQLKLIDPDKVDPVGGICSNLGCGIPSVFCYVATMWWKYSGNEAYPVPHPDLPAYEAYYKTSNIWDENTTYGKNRRELLAWAIKFLEQYHAQ